MVNNMAGAGTMISANYTYNQAAKDGTVINSFDGGIVPSQIYGASSVQFDLAKFNYIGSRIRSVQTAASPSAGMRRVGKPHSGECRGISTISGRTTCAGVDTRFDIS